MNWNEFVEYLQENVEADEVGKTPVTLDSIMIYAGLCKIPGAEKELKRLTGLGK